MSGPSSSLDRSSSVGHKGAAAARSRQASHDKDAVVLASPSKYPREIDLPQRQIGAPQHATAAMTPSFELFDDGLGEEQSRATPRQSPAKGRMSALPSIDVNLAQRSQRRSVNEGSKRPTSPHITVATPTSARHAQSPLAVERRSSMPAAPNATTPMSSQSSSTSTARPHVTFGTPVRQSSLGKAAAHAAQTLIEAVSGRNTPQLAAYVGARPDSASAINRRHVASPDLVGSEHHYSSFPNVFDETGDDELDKGHGNRRQSASASGRWTPTILGSFRRKTGSPVHTVLHSASQKVSPRFQVSSIEPERLHEEQTQQSSHTTPEGRATPAKYRPTEEAAASKLGIVLSPAAGYYAPSPYAGSQQQQPRYSHPLSHAHKMSNSSAASGSSHSIQMNSPRLSSHSQHPSLHASPTMSTHSRHTSMHLPKAGLQPSPVLLPSTGTTANSSPIVVPQARRGAINLRPAGRKKSKALARRRRAAAALAAEAQKKPVRQQLLELLAAVISALRYPAQTARSCRLQVQATIKNIDLSFRDPRTGERVWRPSWLGAYIPLLIWLVVSLSSTFTVLIWHTQVFRALDRLSTYLQDLGLLGRLSLGSLIFLTTFPPLPLYSTLIILCGFSFGLLQGFIISYVAALLGAIVVFLLSRSLLKSWMVELLNKSGGLKRVVRAIEKRPKLLFLVRLAPYPYNLMNTLLASSPTLTLRTYTICTALALPKLLVHCALGTSIKNFAAYNGAGSVQKGPQAPLGDGTGREGNETGATPPILGGDVPAEDGTASHTAETIKHVFGFVGVGLCIGIFIYLFSVARKAVDEELDDEDDLDEYDLVLSDEDEQEEDELEEGSDLDDDHLNIARGSSESGLLDENKKPLLASSRFAMGKGLSQDVRNNRDAGFGRSSGSTGAEGMSLSPVHRKFVPAADGTTPNFTAPRHVSDGNPYFAHSFSQNGGGNRTNRHMESQVSLADSIVEMEKHAIQMEEEPLFPTYSHGQSSIDGAYPSYTGKEDEDEAQQGQDPFAARRQWTDGH